MASAQPRSPVRQIKVLPSELASKIAAGEVVERPASVVKELVENSLDAGALEVSVEVSRGGMESIRVSDNGTGIPPDQVELAVQRFATSKVTSSTDLEAIATLGFRGEALPSIGAVSEFTIVTRTGSDDTGTRLEVLEGESVRLAVEGAPRGTTVTVRHLFRNYPARRKFLKTEATESSRIHALLTRYAMAYPEVRFRLMSKGARKFETSGSGELREVVAAVYSLEVAEALLELSSDAGQGDGPFVWGLISPPSIDRASRGYVSVFVNRRWVQSRMVMQAIEQAYHGFLGERRYPLAVLNLAVPYHELDVNIHPAKTEVRFTNSGRAFSAVQSAVRRTLTALSPVPSPSTYPRRQTPSGAPPGGMTTPFWPDAFRPPPSTSREDPISGDPATGLTPKKALPVLRPLGQVQTTYIVADGPDGVYLIDQHAAHERVVFEQVRDEAKSRQSPSQSLLEPAMVELSLRQQELLKEHREALEHVGFDVDAFGADTVLLRRVPSLLDEGDPAAAFLDILDLIGEGQEWESWEERAAYSIACHKAIRAGRVLTFSEIAELTRQLENCAQPHTCPHGRPTMIFMSTAHVEREFGRR
jgi:DNA mismatch repair protein MutL